SYATLSHCWGTVQPIRLLRSKVEQFKGGINMSDLPRAFREAVVAARNLGVLYIWIDSLCIMQDQDDPRDWNQEASLMHKVYSNAVCNTAASDAADGSEGLFRTRDPRAQRSRASLWITGLDNEYDNTWIPVTVVHKALWEKNVTFSRLNRRGWVFQERILSPRILHFGKAQVFWECRELEATEFYPDEWPITRELHEPDTLLKALDLQHYLAQLPPSMSMTLEDARAALYAGMVELYTTRTLTHPSDRLIAFSGIAQHLEAMFGDEFVAGLWRSQIAGDLRWSTVVDDDKPRHRPLRYRAPSWSWAAVDGPV
ncbi:heterokaryon incompatibility protein-domain-containing protein, partial [Microdochium trichocladiopsis]